MKPRYFARALTAIILLSILLSTMAACDKLPTGKQPTPTEKLIQLPTKTATAAATPTKPQTAGSGGTQTSATVAATQANTPTAQPPGKLGDLTKVKILDTKTQDIGPTGGSVSLKDEITVIVPSGAVAATAKMTINKVDVNDVAAATGGKPTPGFKELASYDVTIGSQHEFKQPLIIQVAYDPGKITSDYPPEKALFAAWWDTELKMWHATPVEVDTQRKVVYIVSDHLTLWTIYWTVRGYKIYETDHFNIVYDPSVFPKIAPEKGVIGTGEQDPYAFAQRAGGYLEQAYKKYMDSGFWDPRYTSVHAIEAASLPTQNIPGTNIPVLALPHAKVFVFIKQGTETSVTESLSGNICLATNFDNADRLKHETAHELFHAVEQRYFTIWGYGARQWWLEACADYAADRLAWGGLNSMDKVRLGYFAAPINTVDTHHEYETARFIDYLVGKGVDFKGLYDAVAAGWTQIIGSFETHVKNKTGTSLHDHYKRWAAYVLFDSSGPLEELKTSLFASAINEGPPALDASVNQLPHTFNLKGNYTAKLWAFKAAPKETNSPRPLAIEATGNIPAAADVEADVYVLKDGQRPQGGVATKVATKGTINSANKSLKLSVAADETVYILAVNTGSSDQSLTLKVSDSALTISPATVSVDAGKTVTFTTPGVTEKVLWSVQETYISGTISAAGVYTAPSEPGTYHVVATLDSNRATTGTAEVTVLRVAPNFLAILQKTTKMAGAVSLQVTTDLVYSKTNKHHSETGGGGMGIPGNTEVRKDIPITWSGSSFSGKADDIIPTTAKTGGAKATHTISGSVSSDGTKVSLTYVYQYQFSSQNTVVLASTSNLELSNVPLYIDSGIIRASQGGTAVGKYVTKFEYSSRDSWNIDDVGTTKYLSFQANNDSKLSLVFFN